MTTILGGLGGAAGGGGGPAVPLPVLTPILYPHTPGASGPAMRKALLEGAIEFCKRTYTLQRRLPDVLTVADQPEYALVQEGEWAIKLLSAKLDGRPLRLPTQADLDDDEDPPAIAPSTTTPCEILLTGPMQVKLVPTPTLNDQVLSVRCAMVPLQSATSIAYEVAERHQSALVDWAIHKMRNVAKTPFYDWKESQDALARFLDQVAWEKGRVFKNRARSKRRASVHWV